MIGSVTRLGCFWNVLKPKNLAISEAALKIVTLSKNCRGFFLGNFWKTIATFYFNIWSRCWQASRNCATLLYRIGFVEIVELCLRLVVLRLNSTEIVFLYLMLSFFFSSFDASSFWNPHKGIFKKNERMSDLHIIILCERTKVYNHKRVSDLNENHI